MVCIVLGVLAYLRSTRGLLAAVSFEMVVFISLAYVLVQVSVLGSTCGPQRLSFVFVCLTWLRSTPVPEHPCSHSPHGVLSIRPKVENGSTHQA